MDEFSILNWLNNAVASPPNMYPVAVSFSSKSFEYMPTTIDDLVSFDSAVIL